MECGCPFALPLIVYIQDMQYLFCGTELVDLFFVIPKCDINMKN